MSHAGANLRDSAHSTSDGLRDYASRDLRPEIRWVLLVASIAVLSVALPAALLVSVPTAPRSEAWIITLVISVWSGVRLSIIWVSGVPRLFDYFLWVFTYIFMGVAPTAQILSGLTSTTTPGVDPGTDLPTAFIVALGLGSTSSSSAVVAASFGPDGGGGSAPSAEVSTVSSSFFTRRRRSG